MRISFLRCIGLIVFVSLLAIFSEAKRQEVVKKTLTIGGITFKYRQEYAVNKVKIPRDDLASFVDTRYDSGKAVIFVVAPLQYKDSNLDMEFLANLRNDIVKAWYKTDPSKFDWKTTQKNISISKYQSTAFLMLGFDKTNFVFIDFRRVKYKNKDFIVGALREQGKGSEYAKNFKENEQIVYGANDELMMAKIARSVTKEEDVSMWPPGGIHGVISPSPKN